MTEHDPVDGERRTTGTVADPGQLGGVPMPARHAVTPLGEYVTAWAKRIRYGESGVLPVVVGLIAIFVYFQSKNSLFLSNTNLANLLVQSAPFIVLGMAEIWVLLLGEIDLSVGFLGAYGAMMAIILCQPPYGLSWWLATAIGLGSSAAFAGLQGLLVILLRLPSFIVTLAGQLFWWGIIIYYIDNRGGSISISSNVLRDLSNGQLTPTQSIIVGVVVVVLYAISVLFQDLRRRRSGLVSPPAIIPVLKVVAMALAVAVLIYICNLNRSNFGVVRGLPWAVVVVGVLVVLYSLVLGRTRFGRYLYAIGGNHEAARRAGIRLGWNRFWAFVLGGFTGAVAMLLLASQQGSISANINGGQYVLYAVAAAVIGGTSLFGGRGRMVHALIGGFVIAAINNGMALLGMAAAVQLMVTAIVLVLAVSIDALARRGSTAR